jgi:hypothetical protein
MVGRHLDPTGFEPAQSVEGHLHHKEGGGGGNVQAQFDSGLWRRLGLFAGLELAVEG